MDGLGKPRGAGRIVSVAKARAVHHMQMSFMRRSLHHVYCNIIYYIMQTSAKVLHALQTCQQKTMQSSHEMDQQSYFYVVWPEERAPTVPSPSAAAGPSSGSPKINAAMAKERIPVGTICEATQGGKHKSVPGEHAAAAKGEDTLHRGPSNLVELGNQVSCMHAALQRSYVLTHKCFMYAGLSQCSIKTIRRTVCMQPPISCVLCLVAGSMAEQAIVHLQRILEATDKHKSTGPSSRQNSLALPCNTASSYTGPTSQAEAQYASISSTLHNGCSYTNGCSTPPPAKRHCNISRSTYATLPTAINADTSDSPFDTVSQCLECEVKDAEIQTLRRRIQLLKEQLASATSWSGERSLTPQVRKLAGEPKSKNDHWYVFIKVASTPQLSSLTF